MKLGFLASHSGSNMQAIIDACKDGRIPASPVVVISNNAAAQALERGKKAGLSTYHLSTKTEGSEEQLDQAICNTLQKNGVDLVILAGYMRKIGKQMLQTFAEKIINIHPALLPKYGLRWFK